ncbi:oxygen-independent coproporphyrinogen III oxidase [Pseudotenacibaculum sp. MALMAid0570]|uniref:oxygen-independent coproporphyrinogen III oxidase n=1 Tax=Pseudotenacibaculum sp. MALMAid0570 TaxID=3143938 RepID=UPI0032DEAE4D
MENLIQKYNVPGPRYTSYPTVPFWNDKEFTKNAWIRSFQKTFQTTNHSEGISLYIHLPFCESLCTFCACHKHITKRHEMEDPYIQTVLKEWELYTNLMNEIPVVKEVHLGGGTPTFFSPKNLQELMNGILSKSIKHPDYEFSFEGHPNNTTREHLQALYDLGFTRVSFGVQDYNEKVQKAIHRVQPFKQVEKVTTLAREIGYTSISHDLVFGLPFQTKECMIETIQKTKSLYPDRISFYSYAHVPWIKGVGQRGFQEIDLPRDEEKRELYEVGKDLLSELGYIEIGMDHFSLPTDHLYTSTKAKKLHRNFMGYTAQKTSLMIGLGMSSISDSWTGFAQNVKTIKEYQTLVNKGEIPVFRGHILSEKDRIVRTHILNLMCQFETSWDSTLQELNINNSLLKELEEDQLIIITPQKLKVLEKGQPFIRNVCMAFDAYLNENQTTKERFSLTV